LLCVPISLGLFKGEPVIYQLEEGKYIIDLIKSFAAAKK